jgi:predicted lipid-binding transport protein (Tim44 family)
MKLFGSCLSRERILRAAAVALALAAVAPADEARAGCRAEPLSGWREQGVRWLGGCVSGAANGLGALKYYDGGALRATFFGEFRNGAAILGVIDKGGSYVAGHVVGSEIADSSDRNEIIAAFRVASRAAEKVSEDFAAAGNKDSAAHYRAVAKKLADQMD